MTLQPCIVDTNVIVSGLIGADSNSPPALILDAMLDGKLLYLMSDDLLDEYSSVLRRLRLVRLHGLTDDEIDRLLADLVVTPCGASLSPAAMPPARGTPTCGRCSPPIRRHNWSRVTGFLSRTLRVAPPQPPLAVSWIRFCPRQRPEWIQTANLLGE